MSVQNVGFSSAQLAFLAAACAAAGAVFYCVQSRPAPLPDAAPFSPLAAPATVQIAEEPKRPDVTWSGRNPFAPPINHKPVPKPIVGGSAGFGIPPEPGGTAEPPKAVPPESYFAFVGVVHLRNESYALLRPVGGGAPLRAKAGEQIGHGYTITHVGKQDIAVRDEAQRPYVLRDRPKS